MITLTAFIVLLDDERLLVNSLAVAGASVSAIAVVEWLWAIATGSGVGVQREVAGALPAAYGFSYEANILGGYLALIGVLLVEYGARQRNRFYLGAAGACFVGLLATQTRAALVGCALGIAVLLCWRRQSVGRFVRRRIMIVVVAGLVCFLVALVARPSVTGDILAKFSHSLDLGSGNAQYRLRLANTALSDLSGNGLITGRGLNSFAQFHVDPSRPGADVPAYLPTLPLQVLYDEGVVGVVLLGALGLGLLSRRRWSPLSVALLACYLCVSLATSPFWFASTWIVAALGCCPRTTAARLAGDSTEGDAGHVAPIPLSVSPSLGA